MFERDYQTAMDNIKADSKIKNEICAKLEAMQKGKKRQNNPAVPWRIGFALAACAALVLSIIFVPRNFTTVSTAPKTLSAADSYGEIYQVLNKYRTEDFFNYITDSFGGKIEVNDEEIIYEYEYESGVVDDAAKPGVSTDISANASGALKGGSSKNESSNQKDYSETTQQVEGVKEADIVKTDGEYIYCLYGNRLAIFKADGENTALVNLTTLSTDSAATYGEMFVNKDRLVLMQPEWYCEEQIYTSLLIYDISKPEDIKLLYTLRQEGDYNSSRMLGNYVYIVSNCFVNIYEMTRTKPETFVPTTICGDSEPQAVAADSIYRYGDEVKSRYTVICAYDTVSGEITSSCSLLGGTDQIYCSAGNIITANTDYNVKEPEAEEVTYAAVNTNVSRLAISDGKIEYIASGVVPGYLEDQFYIDEHKGNFRFVTTAEYCTKSKVFYANSKEEVTTRNYDTFATLTILDGNLEKMGSIDNLAKGEKVYSVRFMGDTAYFVTFRQTDPLFSADLSDPKNPKILGELKIPGFSEYLYPYGEGKLLGFGKDADEKTGVTRDLKLSMFEITDPANVTESDVTIVSGFSYSPALYNHKAMLVSPAKNLIGFLVHDYHDSFSYVVYEYTGNAFARVAQLDVVLDSKYSYLDYGVRGIFIGDDFYTVSASAVQCFEMNTFSQIGMVEY